MRQKRFSKRAARLAQDQAKPSDAIGSIASQKVLVRFCGPSWQTGGFGQKTAQAHQGRSSRNVARLMLPSRVGKSSNLPSPRTTRGQAHECSEDQTASVAISSSRRTTHRGHAHQCSDLTVSVASSSIVAQAPHARSTCHAVWAGAAGQSPARAQWAKLCGGWPDVSRGAEVPRANRFVPRQRDVENIGAVLPLQTLIVGQLAATLFPKQCHALRPQAEC